MTGRFVWSCNWGHRIRSCRRHYTGPVRTKIKLTTTFGAFSRAFLLREQNKIIGALLARLGWPLITTAVFLHGDGTEITARRATVRNTHIWYDICTSVFSRATVYDTVTLKSLQPRHSLRYSHTKESSAAPVYDTVTLKSLQPRHSLRYSHTKESSAAPQFTIQSH
jgi:hypothetical protein